MQSLDITPPAEIARSLEYEIAVLLRRLRRVIATRARLLHPDLSPASYNIIAAISDQGPMRASELVGMFDIDKGAVSRHIAQMISLGLLEGKRDPADGRAQLVSVTAAGAARMDEVSQQRREDFASRLGSWQGDDLGELVRLLKKYNAALEEDE